MKPVLASRDIYVVFTPPSRSAPFYSKVPTNFSPVPYFLFTERTSDVRSGAGGSSEANHQSVHVATSEERRPHRIAQEDCPSYQSPHDSVPGRKVPGPYGGFQEDG